MTGHQRSLKFCIHTTVTIGGETYKNARRAPDTAQRTKASIRPASLAQWWTRQIVVAEIIILYDNPLTHGNAATCVHAYNLYYTD